MPSQFGRLCASKIANRAIVSLLLPSLSLAFLSGFRDSIWVLLDVSCHTLCPMLTICFSIVFKLIFVVIVHSDGSVFLVSSSLSFQLLRGKIMISDDVFNQGAVRAESLVFQSTLGPRTNVGQIGVLGGSHRPESIGQCSLESDEQHTDLRLQGGRRN